MKVESKRLINNIIYILMGLQVIGGLAWILGNLGQLPRFEESRELLAMSEKLVTDEYTGILYPACLRLVMSMERLTGLRGCAVLYILQLVTGYLSYGYFLKQVVFYGQAIEGSKWKIWFFGGFLLTIPTVVQVHMAVLPYSFASSLFIVLLALTSLLWRRGAQLSKRSLLSIGVLWVLCGLINPDYTWLACMAVGISFGRYLMLHRKDFFRLIAVCMAAVLSISVLNGAFVTEGSMGKIQKSVGAALVSRFVWPNFLSYKYFWGPEVTELWDYAGLAELSTYPEKVIYEFGPKLEAQIGKKAANRLYWEMSGEALKLGTKSIVLKLLEDGLAYICPPLTMLVQLQGAGVSYSGWNYGRMKDYTPMLTACYVEYALGAWACILGLCLVQGILLAKKRRTGGSFLAGYFCMVSLFINLWYVMCNGHMQDYKRLIVNSVLWAFLVVYVQIASERE